MCNKVGSNGGATYVIAKIIAKGNLNIANLLQIFENLLLKNCSTEFFDIAQKQFLVCASKVCSNGSIVCELIAKDNLNVTN